MATGFSCPALLVMACLTLPVCFGGEQGVVLDAKRMTAPVGEASGTAGFTLKLRADLRSIKQQETLFEIPGAVK